MEITDVPLNTRVYFDLALRGKRFEEAGEGHSHVMFLHYPDGQIEGTTGFFRYRDAFPALIEELKQLPNDKPLRVLFAACASGCEPVTFAAQALDMGLFDIHPDLQIEAQDISKASLIVGHTGIYPRWLFDGLTGEERRLILSERDAMLPTDETFFAIRQDVRNRIQYLEPQAVEHFVSDQPYDAVVMLNLLCHLGNKRLAADAMLAVCTHYLCINWGPLILPGVAIEEAITARGQNFSYVRYAMRSPQDDPPNIFKISPKIANTL